MANRILLVFVGFDTIFLLCAALHLLIPVITQGSLNRNPTLSNVASNLLLEHIPLTATMATSVIMFMTFLLSLPSFFLRSNRLFLTVQAYSIVLCALMTLCIGLQIWFSTLETHANLQPIWNSQTTFVQSMLQFKFKCCGYANPASFVTDTTCPNSATAARLGGCMVPMGAYANGFLDIVFTTFFGFVAVDVMLLLSVLCLIKDRKERERYRLIDEKSGLGGI